MRYWLTHSSQVSLREQVATQILLGIASGELAPGARLPSTRAMARRFKVHANTVSGAYRQLEREGRVELRRGSGVFVRAPTEAPRPEDAIDRLIGALLAGAQREGVDLGQLAARLNGAAIRRRPRRFVLYEPDVELSAIVLAELRQVLTLPVSRAVCSGDGELTEDTTDAIPLALPSKVAACAAMLPAGAAVFTLNVRSVPESLSAWLPAPAGVLVGVVSRWPKFGEIAQVMLASAGFSADAVLVRDATEPEWSRGLAACAGVVCDVVMALQVPAGVRTIVFRLIADGSLAQLRALEQQLTAPDTPGEGDGSG